MEDDIEMKPLWLEFPYPSGSMGWRMGHGEVYYWKWRAWYAKLWPQELRDAYAAKYPEPEGWTGFYSAIGPQEAPPGTIVKLSRRNF